MEVVRPGGLRIAVGHRHRGNLVQSEEVVNPRLARQGVHQPLDAGAATNH
ncbi:MAG: hypothetical protein GY953_25585 [bacterium]|nr:hypothetical protein [bacterium]